MFKDEEYTGFPVCLLVSSRWALARKKWPWELQAMNLKDDPEGCQACERLSQIPKLKAMLMERVQSRADDLFNISTLSKMIGKLSMFFTTLFAISGKSSEEMEEYAKDLIEESIKNCLYECHLGMRKILLGGTDRSKLEYYKTEDFILEKCFDAVSMKLRTNCAVLAGLLKQPNLKGVLATARRKYRKSINAEAGKEKLCQKILQGYVSAIKKILQSIEVLFCRT